MPERLQFIAAADKLLAVLPDDGHCPLCGQPADLTLVKERISATLDDLRSASDAHGEAERGLRRAAAAVRARVQLLDGLHRRAINASLLISEPPQSPADTLPDDLKVSRPVSRSETDAYLEGTDAWLTSLKAILATFPLPSQRDTRLVDLATLCEQGRRWRKAKDEATGASKALALADKLHDICQRIEGAKYEAILRSISERVAELYTALHPDEGLTGVAIEPWTEKGLELVVDFHGTRQRPPHGVLSESHLNSLAVALFLAMAEMFNEGLDVIVLDDVVNSFDVEHRGRLAEVLVSGFKDRQLIVLTHDHQFYLHLARRAPDWLNLELTSWSFEEGPRETRYATGRLLASARQALDDGDVQGGAQKARRALEELLDEACEAMEAALPFRRGHANDRRELAELMGGLRRRIKSVSRDWHARLEALLTDLEADVQAALNIEVHAGRGWASRAEVGAVLARVQRLDAELTCASCGSRIWARGSRNAGRCVCGLSTYPPALGSRTPS